MNEMRNALITIGFVLSFVAWTAVFFTDWYWVPIIGSLLCLAAAGLIREGGNDDCGYDDTPFGLDRRQHDSTVRVADHESALSMREIDTPADLLAVIDGSSRKPTWPHEAGAPE